jgi:SOUL heme-binding protein
MRLAGLVSAIWLAGCSVFGIRETPEPPYRLLASVGSVEIRQYGPRIAAETIVSGDEIAARSAGFKRLAGYIFGANHAQSSIATTAPEAQQPGGSGESITMTAPVAQAPGASGMWQIQFFMPAGFTLASLPAPNDQAVHLVPVPSETDAVVRFSGTASPASVALHRDHLMGVLAGSIWRPVGAPVTWFYDPPWTLPPLRRNEVAVAVERR